MNKACAGIPLGDLFDSPLKPKNPKNHAVILYTDSKFKLHHDKIQIAVPPPFFALACNLLYEVEAGHSNALNIFPKTYIASKCYDFVQTYDLTNALDVAMLMQQVKKMLMVLGANR